MSEENNDNSFRRQQNFLSEGSENYNHNKVVDNINDTNKLKVKGDDLNTKSIFSYSIGHFQNDICAACWFFFMSYYLVHIKDMNTQKAGFVILAGQIADAIATPLVGVFSDRTETSIGKRTPWYIGGTFVVIISFTLMFQSDYVLPKNTPSWLETFYFIINPSIFNIGWAAVQVSHMSLLPSISLSKKKQDLMTRMRTGFTFGSQLISLLLSLFYFAIIDDKILQYSLLSLTCIGLGIITSSIFLIYCREITLSKNIPHYYQSIKTSISKRLSEMNIEQNELNKDKTSSSSEKSAVDGEEILVPTEHIRDDDNKSIDIKDITWRYWLKKTDFYYYMAVYMFVRLAINVSNSMIPFYCKNILLWNKEDGTTPVEISIFLIISNVGSVLNSIFLENFLLSRIKKKNHRVGIFVCSLIVILIGTIPLYFLGHNIAYYSYPLAFLMGIGFSLGLSGASSLINDVIGSKGVKGAFVFGTYSFADKISCGIVLFFMIQVAESSKSFLKFFMSFFPSITIFAALSCVYVKKVLRKDENFEEEINNTNKKKNYGTILDNSILTFV